MTGKNVKAWVIYKDPDYDTPGDLVGITCDFNLASKYAETENHVVKPTVILETVQEGGLNEKVQNLVAEGKIKEACELAGHSDLVTRLENAKKQYNMGLLDDNDWNRVKNQVAFAILEAVQG